MSNPRPHTRRFARWLLSAGAAIALSANAADYQWGDVSVSVISQITAGAALRLDSPNPDLLGLPGSHGFVNATQSANWGDANYKKGQLYSEFIKGSHEALFKFPEDWKIFARGTWLHDFKAADTDYVPLTHSAYVQAVEDVRLLDLWFSKDMDIGGKKSRLRVGNQVVSWGESLFVAGGINQTNGLDLLRFTQPGVPLKEVVMPSPMVSFSTSVARGVNVEAYYQMRWAPNRFIAPGTFFSASNYQGNGRGPLWYAWDPYAGCDSRYTNAVANAVPACYSNGQVAKGSYSFTAPDGSTSVGYPVLPDVKGPNQGQWGVSAHLKPANRDIDLGVYFMRYHDKNQYFQYVPDTTATLASGNYLQWVSPSYETMMGVSTNFQLWNWAWGLEASYRPHDPIQVDPFTAPNGGKGTCVDGGSGTLRTYCSTNRYQLHGTWWKVVNPSDSGGWLVRALGAQASNVQGEAVWVKYPGVRNGTFNNIQLYADLSTDANAVKTHYGSASSYGVVAYFDLTYDSTLIPGWQVIPNVTITYGIKGDTPNANATFFEGNHAVAAALTFNQNPTVWQGSLVLTRYGGGSPTYVRNYYKDRSWIGFNLARNF